MSKLFSESECLAIVASASGRPFCPPLARKADSSDCLAASVESLQVEASSSVEFARKGPACGKGPSEASTPRPVTRGESNAPQKHEQRAKVDWLNATFLGPDRYTPKMFIDLLSKMFRRPLAGIEGRGVFGFDKSIKLIASVGSSQFPIGCLAYGGEAQRGRWMLQMTGSGCSVVRSWSRMAKLLQALDARITRLDLALDFLKGEYTVDDAVQMYRDGEFALSGRPPSTSCAGDWLEGIKGRTLYIGKAVNGKMLRVYEKGRQLGDYESDWVRFEVQLGNRDRVIPFEAMTKRDEFLAGCYPALDKMLEVAAESIPTTQTEGRTSIGHLLFHLKRSYGKLVNTVMNVTPCAFGDLIEGIVVYGSPRRLKPADVEAKLTWEQLLSQLRKCEK